MTLIQPGWYPDPSGDPTKLRYWDGAKWTDNVTSAAGATPIDPTTAAQAEAQAAQAAQQAAAQSQAAAQAQQQAANQAAWAAQQQAAQQYAAQQAQPVYMQPGQIYPLSSQDSTLRLIAFILNIVSCVVYAPFIIPLAWGIPMTIHSWRLYKGTRPNSVAFGVCDLIFLNLVSGILLLISTKER